MIDALHDTIAYARERNYTGWDLYDGESSRLLQALPISSKWLNLVFQQVVCRAPVNLRPLLLVEQRRNFKGAALFALANLDAYELTGERQYRRDAHDLVEWLLDDAIDGYSGFCGGHNHPVQHLDYRATSETPGVVGTSYAVKALVRADDEFDEPYGDVARSAAEFVFDDLDYTETADGARIKYKPDKPDEYYTLNANALGARLLVDLYDHCGTDRYRHGAERILGYVASKQTDAGGWMYRDPPSASHLSMDNYHNGFIIESFVRYHTATGTTRYADVLAAATRFYRQLFDADGAPHYDETSAYPRDIHAVAQGAITFTALGDLSFAERILDWGLNNLYGGDGRFYFQQHRYYTTRITLMRWCQAWMAYALSTYLRAREGERMWEAIADERLEVEET